MGRVTVQGQRKAYSVVPSIVVSAEMAGYAVPGLIVHTPSECPTSATGISNLTVSTVPDALASSIAARRVHSGSEPTIPPVSQTSSPGLESMLFPVELTVMMFAGAGTGGAIVGLYWSDLNAGGHGSGATYEVTEDPISGTARHHQGFACIPRD